ncbi:MAG: SUMF1/EgtB/PvdO family nonheme iron enzyme, partial [Byssovorax sp.]
MVWIEGGTFQMGSEDFYPEERPVHAVKVDGFWIDAHTVTNDEFSRFVEDTGYLTLAERPLDPRAHPGASPELLVPGSLVFCQPTRRVALDDWSVWWAYLPGASFRHPEGPESSLEGRGDVPVVHVAHEDAEAYAAWAGKSLPTAAQWEVAARGGLVGSKFTWGDELHPGGRRLANTWEGEFPWQSLREDGELGPVRVGSFPPNGYGLFDMAGNVWEWT